MRKRNNLTKALLVIFMTAAMQVQTPVYAEETAASDYERVHASYGERVENYVYQVDKAGTLVNVVITSEGKAHTYTDTNLREGPGIETRSLMVLPTGAQVLVWGYTDNGWTKVFYRSGEGDLLEEGQDSGQIVLRGYIKSDLLEKDES